ncbi:fibrinogen-like protein 1 [Drosophila innubila]|uniref:fibrinogen-like protein 1 n=1 Tax=Drosophila innubila TaxID=198719 RepID=UPI00148D5BD9|nr:fibrinogen-like protein 1 [Drosophila innubila]
MKRAICVLIFIAIFHLLNAQADLLEIFRLQKELKNSYSDLEKLQAKYKTKLREAIMMQNENVIQDINSHVNDELLKCREQNLAFEGLNKIYVEQIADLQNKVNTGNTSLEEKDRQVREGLETITVYTTIINDQATQIELLKEDLKIKSQIIFHMETRAKDINDRFKNLEDLTSSTSTDIEENSCLPFGESTDVHLIKVDEDEPFPVPCESRLSGPGWTVVQRRIDGSVQFNRNWLEYKEGFGNLSGEFFIGLEKLHRMTSARSHELYIYMIDFNNESSYAHYDNIIVDGESEQYTLRELGDYTGTAGDSMRDNEHQKFSTLDRDNDVSELNCAQTCLGGWWYNNCGLSNLNGQYSKQDDYYDSSEYGIYWDEWHGPGYTLQSVQMLIRPKINTEK